MRPYQSITIKALLILLMLAANYAAATEWTVTKLSVNSYDDMGPQVYGSNVVWWGSDGHDYEILLYDGINTNQLTNNSYDDWYSQISGSNVVWWGSDGHDWEIFLYDGTDTTQLTNNSYDDEFPQVSGSNVVWYG
ncbi:MAG: hypothetical protein JSV03_17115, partial [Planctomycetota bacterium]